MTTATPPAATPPAGRYGPERSRRSPALIAAIAVAVVVGLVVVTWLAIGAARDPVQWKDVGFVVHDAGSVEVTFEVTKASDATATCRVQALSQSYAEVGVVDVEVGPGARSQRVTTTVPTAELAVTGTVESCTV
ncbi:DUF4307 domain-containing protein [Cellulomonas composti]|uniref:DUF4307 domain-containing protein n=1 Tax=Cellulomonas composti TaxID=266130 RepID=A0A511JAW3_9CELL|nr:DUF4307 domain-containing protein [Cellulomonas composti]GEL94919.1 hypothetical protein CCO02nite_15770 [Cellulomonas composti]